MHATNYSMKRVGKVGRTITAQHSLEQYQLDTGAPALRSRICGIVSASANAHARMQAILQAIRDTMPATAMDRLDLTGLSSWIRDTASGESAERFIENMRTWKLPYAIEGGFRVRIDHGNRIVINCSEMANVSLEGGWVQQASQLRCSLVLHSRGFHSGLKQPL